jgi:hypothetical protein
MIVVAHGVVRGVAPPGEDIRIDCRDLLGQPVIRFGQGRGAHGARCRGGAAQRPERSVDAVPDKCGATSGCWRSWTNSFQIVTRRGGHAVMRRAEEGPVVKTRKGDFAVERVVTSRTRFAAATQRSLGRVEIARWNGETRKEMFGIVQTGLKPLCQSPACLQHAHEPWMDCFSYSYS